MRCVSIEKVKMDPIAFSQLSSIELHAFPSRSLRSSRDFS